MKSCYSILLLLLLQSGFAQSGRKAQGSVFVDQNGTMRWSRDQREVQGFGVNYTLPFAHAFRATKNLGIAHQRAIDQDVAQFARLGFDLFRTACAHPGHPYRSRWIGLWRHPGNSRKNAGIRDPIGQP